MESPSSESLELVIEISSSDFEGDTPIKVSQQSSSNVAIPSMVAITFQTIHPSHALSNFSHHPLLQNLNDFLTVLQCFCQLQKKQCLCVTVAQYILARPFTLRRQSILPLSLLLLQKEDRMLQMLGKLRR